MFFSKPAILAGFGALLLSAPTAFLQAQSQPQQMPPVSQRKHLTVGDTSIFAPLQLPTPNVYRSGSGKPGPHYWQNKVDYSLSASLDTARHVLSAAMLMRFTNNSPDTLEFIWVHLEQNAFRPGALNSLVFPSASRHGARDFEGGYTIHKFTQVINSKRVDVNLHDNGTIGRVDLARPILPGQTATFDVAWSFAIPEHGADRMGRDGSLYQIAQWFPKAAVYDDIKGWNIEQYLGQGEFYFNTGDYTLEITVPAGFIVAATGVLENPKDVLTSIQRSRLEAASRSDTVVRVITEAELRNGTARPESKGMLTWKFVAKNVRDVAWVASPDYLWDASSWNGVMAHAFYRPAAARIWEDAADQTRESIQEYSERWYMYPYPQATSVEGPVYGMEYPMLAMQQGGNSKQTLYDVLTHEVGHNWFPMILGSNERVYAWFDEGFNTFMNLFAEARRFPANGTLEQRVSVQKQYLERFQQMGMDEPVDIPPDRVDPKKLGLAAYYKPSVALHILRKEILGEDVFDKAFKEYIRRWAFKHPDPADFFRTMENVSGQRLDWFWRGWFLENAHFDQGIDSVKSATNSDGVTYVGVWYANVERGVLPLLVRFTFSDGSYDEYEYPADVWSTNTSQYVRSYVFPSKTVTKIEIDPDRRLVDKNRENNVWLRPAEQP